MSCRCPAPPRGSRSIASIEVRNARPKLRQLIASYGKVLLAHTFQLLTCNAVHPVEARCCRWLLMLHLHLAQDTLPLTHEFLAEMLGVQRSTVSP